MNRSNRLQELISDWHFLLKRDGVTSAIPQITLEISWLPYRHLSYLILSRSLDEPLPVLYPKISLDIRPIQETDITLIREIHRPSEARLCSQRLARGHYGLVAMNHLDMAGYAWGCPDVDPKFERIPLKLELQDILFNDAYTIPAYRGKGVQTALTLARMDLFNKLGYKRAICFIEVKNIPSISVWQKKFNGYVSGSIDFRRIGPWYKVKIYSTKS